MALTTYDPNGPLIDPDVQALLDRYRQQQLLRQLSGQQEDVGNPKNVGEGINALGKGAANMLMGFAAHKQASDQAALQSRIASTFGGMGGSGMPMPRYTEPAGMAAPLSGAGPLGSVSPSNIDTAALFSPHRWARGLVPASAFNSSLIAKGLSPAAAAGVTGNATWESGAPKGYVYLDPATDANVKNWGTGDAAVGSIQWEGARKAGVGPSLESQTKHIADELRAGNQGLSLASLNAIQDPAQAAAAVNRLYERPKDPAASMVQRQAYARHVYGSGGVQQNAYQGQPYTAAAPGGPQSATGYGKRVEADPTSYGVPPGQEAMARKKNADEGAGLSDAQKATMDLWLRGGGSPAARRVKPPPVLDQGRPDDDTPIPPKDPLNPVSYGVPPGQVAGDNVVPANLPPPISEGRSVARTAPDETSPDMMGAPPVRFQQTTPLGTPGHYLPPGPVPIGPQQGLAPGGPIAGGGPQPPPVAETQARPPAPTPPVQAPAAPPPPPAAPIPAGGGPGRAPPGTHWAQLPGPPLLLADNQDAATAGGGGQATSPGLLAQLFGGSAQAAPIRAPAGPALAGGLAGRTAQPQHDPMLAGAQGGPPVQQSQAAQSGGQESSGNPYFDNLVQQHSYAMGQAVRYKQGAAQAFGTPMAAQFDAEGRRWEGIADKTREEANAFILKRQEQAHERPMTQEEADAHDIKDRKSYAVNDKTGEIKRIQGLEEGDRMPTAEDIQKHPWVGDPKNAGMWMFDKNDKPIYVGPKASEVGSDEDKNVVIGPGGELTSKKTGEVIHKNKPESSMSPETTRYIAEQLVLGNKGVLTGLNRGAQGGATIAAIQDEARKIAEERGIDPQGVVDNISATLAQQSGARTAGQYRTKLDIFGDSASRAATQAIELSNLVPRSKWVPINKLLLMGKDVMSDPDLRDFNAGNETLVNEYVRATTMSGMNSDQQRTHAYDMLRKADSPEAYERVAHRLQWEVGNIANATERAVEKLRKGTGGPSMPEQYPLSTPSGKGAPAADPLAEERDAIKRGAPRDKVIERAIKRGKDTSGL